MWHAGHSFSSPLSGNETWREGHLFATPWIRAVFQGEGVSLTTTPLIDLTYWYLVLTLRHDHLWSRQLKTSACVNVFGVLLNVHKSLFNFFPCVHFVHPVFNISSPLKNCAFRHNNAMYVYIFTNKSDCFMMNPDCYLVPQRLLKNAFSFRKNTDAFVKIRIPEHNLYVYILQVVDFNLIWPVYECINSVFLLCISQFRY